MSKMLTLSKDILYLLSKYLLPVDRRNYVIICKKVYNSIPFSERQKLLCDLTRLDCNAKRSRITHNQQERDDQIQCYRCWKWDRSYIPCTCFLPRRNVQMNKNRKIHLETFLNIESNWEWVWLLNKEARNIILGSNKCGPE